ncbi:cobalt-precorrin-6A synthase [Oxobacter pfennigii]|uniref:Cobalt-precorrin-5B C(1)-methyltransferase n=1 Tax=Oxobacter pfennigii TaxID=36849 RepID=A0A0P8W9W8_9CLOT|nr:cobalt-precorrin-5B (C(1))-methyltransferase CbiD [Oxobacter pfennigii]KPU45405.1 cobalt-precorrin-6A synthase [Oxobacter pfennigii]
MTDLYVIKEGKKLRCGYTTGSCAAAAAKAAVTMLETEKTVKFIEIDTPAGVRLNLEVKNPHIGDNYASCCIIKDGGDDPDSTDGMEIYVKVTKRQDNYIIIDGGEGIGRIKKTGLFGNVGEAAINPVPRRMIHDEIKKVSNSGYDVLVYAPQGVEVGKRTFNENIGIEGGISIIGTKGIVEPMSEEALLKTIYIEIDSIYEDGVREIILFPGNYGEKMTDTLGLQGRRVKISNFIGDTVSYCYSRGFESIILVGHIGKLCKLSVGAFNTHSKICDVRMEAFVYYLALKGASNDCLLKVSKCLTSEEALEVVKEHGYVDIIEDMKNGCIERIKRYIKNEDFNIKLYMYSMKYGVL